ncbi:MAG: DUF4829 domain-containing protein [Oscillospiraceae bacterium]|jgi:hypothetical protein|nr:DUF4829 domain-containing protein [Oscillospiraceae bacterium]
MKSPLATPKGEKEVNMKTRKLLTVVCLVLCLALIAACAPADKPASPSPNVTSSPAPEIPLPDFAQEDIAAVRAVVDAYFLALTEGDADALWATRHGGKPSNAAPAATGVVFTLNNAWFDAQDHERREFMLTGGGSSGLWEIENVIVFRCDFTVTFGENATNTGAWEEMDYGDYILILTREDTSSPWLIADSGY